MAHGEALIGRGFWLGRRFKMGIRVHKVIGYGLKTTTPDMFFDHGVVMSDYNNTERYENFIKDWPGLSISMFKNKNWNLDRHIIYDHENSPILIIPPGYPDWYRYDDSIDFAEETRVYNQQDRIVEFQQGIWPHLLHQNSKGDKLNPSISHAWWREFNAIKDGVVLQEHIQEVNKYIESFSKKLGFTSFHDARDNIAPYVPDVVRAFCEFTNIFIDPDTILKLRPMLMVYWR